MKLLLVILTVACASAESSLVIEPAVITRCTPDGKGRAVLHWNAPNSPVTVFAGTSALTGASPSEGSAPTGYWVTDGMQFTLVDSAGKELARASALVRCGVASEVLTGALTSASFFPLQVGNEWIYFNQQGAASSNYLTRRIRRTELQGGSVWFVVEEFNSNLPTVTETLYRPGEFGRIYRLYGDQELLWLDPSSTPDTRAVLSSFLRNGTVEVPAGIFTNILGYRYLSGKDEVGSYARGVGQLQANSVCVFGSCFVQRLELVYAKIDSRIVYSAPAVSLELSVEASVFDVSNQLVTNCQPVVCTQDCQNRPYLPCFRSMVRTGDEAPSIELDLLDSSNTSLYHATVSGPSAIHSVELYRSPNQPFAPGTYRLRAQTPDGRQSTIPILLK